MAKHPGDVKLIAEVVAIGDELTSGQRVDTNSAWLSQQLGSVGIPVGFHTTVSDDLTGLGDAFRIALGRANVVICTGGLGPTADDLTRQALGDATGRPLQLDEDSLKHIRGLFESRGKEMPERNQVQAMFPEGSRVVANPHGTAPGIDLSVSTDNHASRIFCLPGVPAEMREMWDGSVCPELKKAGLANEVIIHHRIKCFGIGESDMERRLPDLIERGREPSVGITVHKATITLRITAKGKDEAECRQAMQPTIAMIHDCLGNLVYGEEDDEVQDAVIRELAAKNQSVTTVEWGTPGVLARWLREADHDRQCYSGGLVLSQSQLDIGKLEDSDPMLERMIANAAEKAREQNPATYGLAVGPIDMERTRDPNAKLWLGMASPEKSTAVAVRFAGHPDIVMERSAKQALNLLRLRLVENS